MTVGVPQLLGGCKGNRVRSGTGMPLHRVVCADRARELEAAGLGLTSLQWCSPPCLGLFSAAHEEGLLHTEFSLSGPFLAAAPRGHRSVGFRAPRKLNCTPCEHSALPALGILLSCSSRNDRLLAEPRAHHLGCVEAGVVRATELTLKATEGLQPPRPAGPASEACEEPNLLSLLSCRCKAWLYCRNNRVTPRANSQHCAGTFIPPKCVVFHNAPGTVWWPIC